MQRAPSTTSDSMTQNSPIRTAGPMTASGETMAVGATAAEESMGMNPYDKPIGGTGAFANPGLTPSFRRSLPETGCLSVPRVAPRHTLPPFVPAGALPQPGELSSLHASSRIGGMARRHLRRRRREGTDRGGCPGIGRRGRRGVRGYPQGGGHGRILRRRVPDRASRVAVLILPDRDPRGGAPDGVRARHEPLLPYGGTQARRPSHGRRGP